MRLSARALLVGLFVALAAAKAWLAFALPLFGDESFYWLESRHLAAAYSDVPPATPALIAIGTLGFPGHAFGVRWVFVLLGSCVPPLVFAWARRFVGVGEARAAAALSMLLPLSAGLGVLALPDVPLTLATLACAITFAHALDSDRWRDWLLFGAALAAGWLSHYRFALIAAAAAVFLLGFPRGRAAWRSRGFVVALAVGLLGLLPTLVFNLEHDGAGLRFQFVERHPWSPHAGALVEPLVQAVLATPLLFLVLCVALWRAWCWRARRDAPYDVLAGCAGGLLLLHFALGPVVDAERVRFHWPVPALLLALPLVPGILREWRERGGLAGAAALACVPLAALGTAALFGLLALATQPAGPGFAPLGRPQPDNLQGWREVGRWAAGLAGHSPERTLIADHFMGAAQVAFAVGDARPVFALDHPLNHKHGRAVQLAVMGRDEGALAAGGWRQGLLLVEETSRREIDRVPAMLALCPRFGSLRRHDELVLFGGRWRWHAFVVTPPVPGREARPCELPATADWSLPAPGAVLAVGAQEVSGWAMADFTGVRGVEVLLDGVARATARYGEPFPGVQGQWPMSRDPHHPDVGFRATLALRPEDRGARVLALRVTEADGRARVLAERRITIAGAP